MPLDQNVVVSEEKNESKQNDLCSFLLVPGGEGTLLQSIG